MKAITREWLKYAENDLETAKTLLDHKPITNNIVYHSHQVVEKCFKAILEENDQTVPKTHNLLTLHSKIQPFVDFTANKKLLNDLSKIYIDTKYPTELGLLPKGMPTFEEAVSFYEFAKEIYEKTLNLLEK